MGTVRVEGQNSFRYRYPNGVVLAGKPDLLAQEDGEAVLLLSADVVLLVGQGRAVLRHLAVFAPIARPVSQLLTL
jgi:hypothetical protein